MKHSLALPVLLALAAPFSAQSDTQGILPVPDYSGDWARRSKLTGDWGGLRSDWAERGIQEDLNLIQTFGNVVDGGLDTGPDYATNIDYHLRFDLMRMGLVPGALASVRVQSRWDDSINGQTGLILPVDSASAFPFSNDSDGEVDIAVTELNWTQFLNEQLGVVAGKITTLKSANEFMGGEGQTQFMNFQLMFPGVVAQLAPYSTLAVGGLWLPTPDLTLTSLVMNTTDASTTSGFDDIDKGTTWATTLDYLASLNGLPGGGTVGVYYAFDGDFAKLNGLNFTPGIGPAVERASRTWVLSWSGWQYLMTESGSAEVDPRDGKQDLQGLGVFAHLGIADENTNPSKVSAAVGLSGRGSLPGRESDTWGAGVFYNDLQDIGLAGFNLDPSTSGVELYYDIAVLGSVSLTLDAQWTDSVFPGVDDAYLVGARLNVSL